MKLMSRTGSQLTFRLPRSELEAWRSLLGFRVHFPRRSRPLYSDGGVDPAQPQAQTDLEMAMAEHRQELGRQVEEILQGARPVKPGGDQLRWTLTTDHAELMLQALNEVTVGAWEKLGCPDFESGERPEMTAENTICIWAIQMTDRFKTALLMALMGGEEAG